MNFKESTVGLGTLVDSNSSIQNKRGKLRKIPCFPIKSLLLALNQKVVHFFSLDVEGFELDILKTVPWAEIDIQTLAVEYAHAHGRGGQKSYKEYMVEQGYEVYTDIHYHNSKLTIGVDDFIFKTCGI